MSIQTYVYTGDRDGAGSEAQSDPGLVPPTSSSSSSSSSYPVGVEVVVYVVACDSSDIRDSLSLLTVGRCLGA